MATEEQLDLIIRMVAQIGDAQKVISSLEQITRAEHDAQQQAAATANGIGQSAQQVGQAMTAMQRGINESFRQAFSQGPQTFQQFQDLLKQFGKGGALPTLSAEDLGLDADKIAAELKSKEPLVSRAFAELMSAARAPEPAAGGAAEDPAIQTRLYAARVQQQRLFDRLTAQRQREEEAARRAAERAAEQAAVTRTYEPSRAFVALQAARQSAEGLEDPQNQARLYAARAQQERQIQQLIAERARTASRGGAVVTEAMPAQALERFNTASKAIADTTTATKALDHAANVSTTSMIRLGGSLVGLSVGLSLFSFAGRITHDAIQTIVEDSIRFEQVMRANTVALGAQAQGFQDYARTVSEQSGVTQENLLRAGTLAEQLQRQVRLPVSTEGLTALATALARLQGTSDVADVMTRLSGALRGNEQAAESLGLQLDASYVAYTQLDGAVGAVFNQLDPTTQAALRLAAATDQLARQSGAANQPINDLAKAQGDLAVQWETLSNRSGPGLLRVLTGAVALAAVGATAFANMADALGRLNELTTQRAGQSSDEGFKNEAALVQQFTEYLHQAGDAAGVEGQRIANDFDGVLSKLRALQQLPVEATAGLDELGVKLHDAVQQGAGVDIDVAKPLNDAFDASGRAIDEWKGRVADGFDQIKDGATAAAQAIGVVADRTDRAARSEAGLAAAQARQGQLAEAGSRLAAARQNEVNAAQALVELQYQGVQLAADEAAIRLSMLPAMQQMAQTQNELTQAQIRANQSVLPATRELEDLQNEIARNRLIASSGERTVAERGQAAATGAGLGRGLPEAELRALEARMSGLPVQRAGEDVQNQLRLQQAQQQAVLFPIEFQQQQTSLLQQIASAAKSAAERTVELTIQAINVIMDNAQLTNVDYDRISELAGKAVADAIHQAVQSQGTRAAPAALAGAGIR